ncbi:MAG: hypothetical protein WD022_08260 [Balneolaceae bacterium]
MKTFNIVSLFKTLFASIFLIAFAAACSNSASDDHEEHSDPEGFVLKMNGQNIVTQTPGGTLTGEFELEPGQETDLITLYFLDADGDEFRPTEDEYTLGYEFEDTGIAEFEQHAEDGKWSFHLHAEEVEDSTNLRLMLMHNGHSDFTTQDIPVHVVKKHSDPKGFVFKMNGQKIVTQTTGGTLTGEIDLVVGEETDLITIYFLDHDGDEFQPEEDEYSLGYEFDPEDIAEFEQHPEDGRWSFHIHAEAEGVTNLQLMLMHGTHSDFTTQDIHVHVEAAE